MYEQIKKPKENTTSVDRRKSGTVANSVAKKKSSKRLDFESVDNRPKTLTQLIIDGSEYCKKEEYDKSPFSGTPITQLSKTGKDAKEEMAHALGEGDSDDSFDLFAELTPEEEESAKKAAAKRKNEAERIAKNREDIWRADAAQGPSREKIVELKNKAIGQTWDVLVTKYKIHEGPGGKLRADRVDSIREFQTVVEERGLDSLDKVIDFVFRVAQAHPLEDMNKRFAFECGVMAHNGDMTDDEAVRVVEDSNEPLD